MMPYRQAGKLLLVHMKSMRRPLDMKRKAADCMMKSFALPSGRTVLPLIIRGLHECMHRTGLK